MPPCPSTASTRYPRKTLPSSRPVRIPAMILVCHPSGPYTSPGSRKRAQVAVSLHFASGHDRLRRPRPVSRALLEPLPARPAGALQGLRPRRRVVARQPAAPDGHLPARLLGALEGGRRHRPLPAVPALRPRGLGLLLDLARLVRALDARVR